MSDEANVHREKLVRELNEHIQSSSIKIRFPAAVSRKKDENTGSEKDHKGVRTDVEFINLRLLESGVLFDEGQNLGETTQALGEFVRSLEQTGCYNDVQVKISLDSNDSAAIDEAKDSKADTSQGPAIPCALDILLDEKKWYKLYVGGGVKHESMEQTGISNIPKVQFETNASLLNLRGVTDNTTISYSIDQTSSSEVFLSHDSPLFSMFPKYSLLYNQTLLSSLKGTQTHFNAKAGFHIDDYEWTRSYKQFNRGIQLTVSNRPGIPDMVSGIWKSLTYFLSFRDIMPRRHPNLPFACDASPDVVCQAGPSLKNSLQYLYRTNGEYTDNRFNPTEGIDYFLKAEIAGPPGDTGFFKMEGGYSFHIPLFSFNPTMNVAQTKSNKNQSLLKGLTLHASLQGGVMKVLDFGGLCNSSLCISDRFFAGGPLQLRGFQHSGIGPRANSGGKSVAGGDSLGGDIYYNSNISASLPSPIFSDAGLRWFGFVNAGTLSGYGVPVSAFMRSSRISVGGGACFGSQLGRVELTYAVPLRYGSKDARKSFQFGFGFSFN